MFLSLGLHAQVETPTIERTEGANLMSLLPPLQLLIDSAIANSPDIMMAEAAITRSEYEVKKWWEKDPLNYAKGNISPEIIAEVAQTVMERLERVVKNVNDMEYGTLN